MIITKEKNSNSEESTLSRKELLILQKTAGEIQPIKENKLKNFQNLLDEINHLSKWFRWTSEEKNLVLVLKLKGGLTKNMANFDIFTDWTVNCTKLSTMFDQKGPEDKIKETKQKVSKFPNPTYKDSKKCHFCGHLGHIIKNCKILQKIKHKKKLLKTSKFGSKEVNTVDHNSDDSIKTPSTIDSSSQTPNFVAETSQILTQTCNKSDFKKLKASQKEILCTVQYTQTEQHICSKFSQTNFSVFCAETSSQTCENIIISKHNILISSENVQNEEKSIEYAQNFEKLASDMIQIFNDHKQPIDNDSFILHNDEIFKSMFQHFEPTLKSFKKKSKKYLTHNQLDTYVLNYFEKFHSKINEYNKKFKTQSNFEFLNYEKKRKKLIYQSELHSFIKNEITKFLQISSSIVEQKTSSK